MRSNISHRRVLAAGCALAALAIAAPAAAQDTQPDKPATQDGLSITSPPAEQVDERR